ncbi:MAG: beta-propeller fold lactonase family protein [Nitrospinae bacterium]|nr:beta-propeller fold lactonase family protein [Nitrospinota bacterium]
MVEEKDMAVNCGEKRSGDSARQRSTPLAISLLLGLALSGGPFVGESTGGEVWVANMKGANVQVIDADSGQVVKAIPTGAGAHNVTFSPDGKLAFISNLGTNSITIIDAVSKEKLADIATGVKAHDVAVSPDGKMAVACNVGAGNITFIDVASRKAVHTMPTGEKPFTAVFSPGGRQVYVVNAGPANISVIDTSTRQITKTLAGAKGAMAIKPTDDWGLLWLTAPEDNKLLLMNPRTGAVESSIEVPGEPHGLAISPDGKTAYVGQRGLNQISMIDIASGKIVKSMPLGKRPDMIAVSSDGKSVFVAIRDENQLAFVSAADLSVKSRVAADGETHGVAYRD